MISDILTNSRSSRWSLSLWGSSRICKCWMLSLKKFRISNSQRKETSVHMLSVPWWQKMPN